MNWDDWLTTIDAVLKALPDDVDKVHPEWLKTARKVIQLVIALQK